jgi:hypothetical protein
MHARIALALFQRHRDRYKRINMDMSPYRTAGRKITTADVRGIIFLVSVIATCCVTAVMIDGLISEEYAISFVPIYIAWCIATTEHLAAQSKFRLITTENTIDVTGYRFSRRWWGGILNACIWMVVLVLFQLYLYDVDTVPTQSFVYLIVLWCSMSIASIWYDFECLKPFSLQCTAQYICNVYVPQAIDPVELLHDRGFSYEDDGIIGDPPVLDDDQDLFSEQVGTQRMMSVNNSVRNSINSSPPRNEDDENGDTVDSHTPAVDHAMHTMILIDNTVSNIGEDERKVVNEPPVVGQSIAADNNK